MIRWILAVVVGCAVIAAPAVAKDKSPEVVKDVPTFLEKQAELRKAIESSKKYSHVKPAAKEKIFAAQDRLAHLLAGHTTVEELNTDDKVAVFNAQSEILAQLDQAEPDRVICENEMPTGSHRPTVSCMTKRERDEQREYVRRTYQGVKSSCISRACGGSN